MICYGVVCYGLVWYGIKCSPMPWHTMACYGMLWYTMLWYTMVGYGMVGHGSACLFIWLPVWFSKDAACNFQESWSWTRFNDPKRARNVRGLRPGCPNRVLLVLRNRMYQNPGVLNHRLVTRPCSFARRASLRGQAEPTHTWALLLKKIYSMILTFLAPTRWV